jgi:type IV secretion system protein TrbL
VVAGSGCNSSCDASDLRATASAISKHGSRRCTATLQRQSDHLDDEHLDVREPPVWISRTDRIRMESHRPSAREIRLQSWASALVKKVMWIGVFYALLINGRTWVPQIIESFTQIGLKASGQTTPMSPSGVFAQGLNIAQVLMARGSILDFFEKPGSSLVLGIGAILIVVSYAIITINFVMATVESYFVISVGYLFLGFGGSRWTAPYTERYMALAVANGIKLVVLYCLIAGGTNLGITWATEAQGIGKSAQPSQVCLDVMGGSLIYMALCWGIPKLFASVMGGAPSLSGGDLASTAQNLATAAIALTGVASALKAGATKGAADVVSQTRAAANIVPPTSPNGNSRFAPDSSSSSDARRHVPPPSTPPSNGSRGQSSYVLPPGYPKQNGSGSGSLANAAKEVGRAVQKVNLHDGAQVSPPQMPINHHDD